MYSESIYSTKSAFKVRMECPRDIVAGLKFTHKQVYIIDFKKIDKQRKSID